MPTALPNEISQLLAEWSGGDRKALDDLMPLVYEELRKLAAQKMTREKPGQTFQATAGRTGTLIFANRN